MERIGPFNYGGDMDDPNNPASPFVKREDVEEAAAAELGISDSELAQIRAHAQEREALLSPEDAKLICQALLSRIKLVRDKLQGTRGYPPVALRRSIAEAVELLSDVLPDTDATGS